MRSVPTWDTSCKGVHQDVISRSLLPGSDTYGFSWLAELYRDEYR